MESQSRSFTAGLIDNSRPSKINSTYIPIDVGFSYSNGLNATLSATHIDQDVEFPALSGVSNYRSKTWRLDAEVSYRLPNRSGKVSFLIKNITDENDLFQDTSLDGEPRQTTLVPETTLQINFSLLI